MVKSNGNHLMNVIPADHRIDLLKVEKLTGKPASLETEQELQGNFLGLRGRRNAAIRKLVQDCGLTSTKD